ncbi:hypothetical protein FFK22_018730 [Mycobacterium sp. KBS0706]|uniref:hypothetical protein n=1 Tax=Mycobacterium sp. KBS0706 TaxID=2578109 RepID=UPI00110FD43C|nr:hypothetical protein [Mycobacterium sp. KBS0706]TSD87088.1 hypothetical protein FFK22_018730 [Mycobacterium sp. KBS0706]
MKIIVLTVLTLTSCHISYALAADQINNARYILDIVSKIQKIADVTSSSPNYSEDFNFPTWNQVSGSSNISRSENVVPLKPALSSAENENIKEHFCPLVMSMVSGALGENGSSPIDTNAWPIDSFGPSISDIMFNPQCGRTTDSSRRRTCTWTGGVYGEVSGLGIEPIGSDTSKYGSIVVMDQLVDQCEIPSCKFHHEVGGPFDRAKHMECGEKKKRLQIFTLYDPAWGTARLSVKQTDSVGVDEP